MDRIVLSYVQVAPVLAAWQAGAATASLSLDLGLSSAEVTLGPDGVQLPNGECLTWAMAQTIVEHETKCFVLEEGEISDIQFFSEATSRVYSLMPTEAAPTMVIGGFPMHRIKGTDPYRDSLC